MVGRYPLPGTLYRGEAVLYFDRPIMLPDEFQDDPGQLVQAEPSIPLQVEIAESALRIRSKTNIGPRLTLTLSEAIVAGDGGVLNEEDRRVTFATVAPEFFQLIKAEESDNAGQLALYFTQPVDTLRAKDYITVTDATGSDLSFAAEASGDKQVNISLDGTPALPLRVQVARGLPSADGVILQPEDIVRTYPTRRTLKVKSLEWESNMEGRSFRFELSSKVNEETLREHLSVTHKATGDTLAYTLRHLYRGNYRVDLLNPPEGAVVLEVAIAAGLQADEEWLMFSAWSSKLIRKLPRLAVQYVDWRDGDAQGYAAHVQFNTEIETKGIEDHLHVTPNVEGLKVTVSHDQGIMLQGDWQSETQYTIEIGAGYRNPDASALDKPLRYTTNPGTIPPYVGFAFEDALYFPRRGEGEFPVLTRNVASIDYRLHRLFENNFVAGLQDLRNKNFYSLRSQWSEQLAEQKVEIQGPEDRIHKTVAPLDTLLPNGARGLFVLEGRANNGRTAHKLMVNTDLGVLAHWENDHLVAFVHDLFTLVPVAGARVTVYSNKNQLLGEGTTGSDGKVRVSDWEGGLGTPALLTASIDGDFTYLDLYRRNDATPASVGADAPYATDAYDAFLYADRDLYRPGETAHLRFLVRRGYTAPAANVPLKLTVHQPNGAEMVDTAITMNDRGTAEYTLKTEKAWPTGKYWVRLGVPGDHRNLGSLAINVEEFVPSQIEVALDVATAHFIAGNEYPAQVTARHLFGTPASDRTGALYAMISAGGFQPDGYDGFSFGHNDTTFRDRVDAGEQDTDAEGVAAFSLSFPRDARLTQPMRAQVVAEVSEEGGRPVTKTLERTLFGGAIVPGLRARVDETPGEVRVDIAALSPAGEAAALETIQVTLERRDWSYYVRRYADHDSPEFTQRYDEVQTLEVPLTAGRGEAVFRPQGWGSYRLRVHSPETPLYATQQFYHSGYYTSLLKEDAPSLVSIKLDGEDYAVGETAQVVLEAPFTGRAVVVMQNAGILGMETVAFEDGKAHLAVALTQEHFPNFWLEVTAIYTAEPGTTQMHPYSSFGMAFVPVQDPALQLDIAFPDLPDTVRPAQRIPVSLAVTSAGAPVANAEITLAAVDAGILNITDYATPAPYAWLTRPRHPNLQRNHYYDGVAYDFLKTPIGGDAAALAKRIGDDMEHWIDTVSLWSGTLLTDADGRVETSLDLPEFNGRLRLMAVASATNGALGSDDARLLVTRPYVMRPSLPRFVYPDDDFEATLSFFNNSESAVTMDWRAVAGGSLVAGEEQGSVAIEAKAEASLRVAMTATESGPATVAFTADVRAADGNRIETLERTMPLPVRTPAVYQQHRELVLIHPGESITLENTRFVENNQLETGLILSASPGIQLFEALEDLIQYPYGCVEQTTSRLMPMYLLKQSPLIEAIAGNEVMNIDNFLRAGVDNLLAMQTADGGLAMWRGGQESYPYGSVYAMHLLTLLRRDGLIPVPDEPFGHLADYVWKVGAGEAGMSGRYSPARQASQQLQRAYALYVLALGGKLEALQRIESLAPGDYPRTARYLLAAALAINNPEHPGIPLLLAAVPDEIYDARELRGALNSRIRNEAMELLSRSALDDTPEAKALLAEQLIQWLKTQRYGSTQEKAFVISALGVYLSELSRNLDQTNAEVSGPETTARLAGGDILRQSTTGAPARGAYLVHNQGQNILYASFMSAGIPQEAPVEVVAEGLRVTRTLKTRDGEIVDGDLQQGQSYRVELQLRPENGLENVVVADLLPAGVEVENARLIGIESDRTGSEELSPEYIDVRDDRVIIAYDTLPHRTNARVHTFTYQVRAVTPGIFLHPGTNAECMYDPTIRARSASSLLRVVAR